MAGMNMGDMMAIMKDLPKFAEQARDLIAKVRALSAAVDEWKDSDYRVTEYHHSNITSANADLKLALANLPRLPNVIEG